MKLKLDWIADCARCTLFKSPRVVKRSAGPRKLSKVMGRLRCLAVYSKQLSRS